jgi:2-methylisocitrate lyase-like PEP mutase family enzyme
LIGVYDVFSATLAAQHFDGIFISGFGFSASFYGLPDIGLISWSDLVAFVQRVKVVLPEHCIVVDIDDGFADTDLACHVVSLLENAGASGVILEDQTRPRRCGHLGGKQVLPLKDSLQRLQRVLQTRRDMFVIARSDATGQEEIMRRVQAYSDTDADAILVDGIGDMSLLSEIRSATCKPLVFNQIAGGASPKLSLKALHEAGISVAIFSTPCLFAAQSAISGAMDSLKLGSGLAAANGVNLSECNEVLNSNFDRRDCNNLD